MADRHVHIQITVDGDTLDRIERLRMQAPGIDGNRSKLVREALREMDDRVNRRGGKEAGCPAAS